MEPLTMTVYVDDMHESELGRLGYMKMSHMIADSTEELAAMAERIGLNGRWIQKRGKPTEHFDVAKGKRALAVAAGAVEITIRQAAAMCRRRAVTGELGDPASAEDWHAGFREMVRAT
jgi:hypothetical protein